MIRRLRPSVVLSVAAHVALLAVPWSGTDTEQPVKASVVDVTLIEERSQAAAAAEKPANPGENEIETKVAENDILEGEAANADAAVTAPGKTMDEAPETVRPPTGLALPVEAGRVEVAEEEKVASEAKAPIEKLKTPNAFLPGGAESSGVHERRPTSPPDTKVKTAADGPDEVEDPLRLIRAKLTASVNYPPLARRRGWEGTVKVRFHIGGGGKPEDIRLVDSSGNRLLDREALRTVESSGPYPRVEGWIVVPITFRLRG